MIIIDSADSLEKETDLIFKSFFDKSVATPVGTMLEKSPSSSLMNGLGFDKVLDLNIIRKSFYFFDMLAIKDNVGYLITIKYNSSLYDTRARYSSSPEYGIKQFNENYKIIKEKVDISKIKSFRIGILFYNPDILSMIENDLTNIHLRACLRYESVASITHDQKNEIIKSNNKERHKSSLSGSSRLDAVSRRWLGKNAYKETNAILSFDASHLSLLYNYRDFISGFIESEKVHYFKDDGESKIPDNEVTARFNKLIKDAKESSSIEDLKKSFGDITKLSQPKKKNEDSVNDGIIEKNMKIYDKVEETLNNHLESRYHEINSKDISQEEKSSLFVALKDLTRDFLKLLYIGLGSLEKQLLVNIVKDAHEKIKSLTKRKEIENIKSENINEGFVSDLYNFIKEMLSLFQTIKQLLSYDISNVYVIKDVLSTSLRESLNERKLYLNILQDIITEVEKQNKRKLIK